MQDFRTLRLLDRFENLFRSFGVDYKMMRKILQVKLTMDGRRVPTIFSQDGRKKDKESNNQFIKSLWIYVLFGLFLIPFILMGENYLFQMSIFYGIFSFFAMTSMIADFSSVLLDIRDRNILFPKPVGRKTINAAKLVHVVIYLFFLTMAIVGIPLIVGFFIHGLLFFIVSVIDIMLINLFVVGLTALIYLLILQFFDGEKLKDIINYVQIGLSLMIMVGYQLLVRSFELIDLTVALEPRWWQVLIFPMWYAAGMEMLMNGMYHPYFFLFSALGILMPLLSTWTFLKFNHTFEENLQKLTHYGKAKKNKDSKFGLWFLRIICSSNEERAFFRFASSMMKNEREFKLKVYPSLGFSIVMPFIFLLNFYRTNVEHLSTSKSYLTIYFGLLIIPTLIMVLKFSGKYKGAWIYRVAPIQQLKPIFSGTIKAFLARLFLPVYLLLSVVFLAIFGVRILPDLITIFLNACMYAVICFMIMKKSIPFSESFEQYNQSNNSAIIFGLMLFVALFAGLHYFSTLWSFGIYIYMGSAIICLATLWRFAFHISWEKMMR